jgi:DNA-binding transcriptional LysR family regulator
MDVGRLEELAREALAESRRNDCELISVAASDGAEHTWSIDLLDVLHGQEPFRVTLETAPGSNEEEIKEAIRRGIAEHFSAASY